MDHVLQIPSALGNQSNSASIGQDAKWNFAEWFVLSQTVLPALLYLPGTQPFRVGIRLATYGIPLLALAYHLFLLPPKARKAIKPSPVTSLLAVSIAYLAVLLAHPTTNTVLAGTAQIFLYLAVLSPVFWIPTFVRTSQRLRRILWLILACSGVNSFVGVMQVRDPDTWMPKEFSAQITQQGEIGLARLTYLGANGERIIRPPGLGDAPGAVCGPAVFALFLGLAFAVAETSWWRILIAVGCAGFGAAAIFFSLVRSSFLIAVGMVIAYFLMQVKRGRINQAGTLLILGVVIITLAFLRAAEAGGEGLISRFQAILSDDPIEFYNTNRGNQIAYALSDIGGNPLGAGLGRWGMMQVYFGDSTNPLSSPIWVEIQWTAFIVDGGFLLLALYPLAVILSLRDQARTAFRGDKDLQQLAGIAFAANCGLFALCFSYPVFLAPAGIQFWLLAASLRGIVNRPNRQLGIHGSIMVPSGHGGGARLGVHPTRKASSY